MGINWWRKPHRGNDPPHHIQHTYGFAILVALAASIPTAAAFILNAIYYTFYDTFWPNVSDDFVRGSMTAILIGTVVFLFWIIPDAMRRAKSLLQE